MNRVIASAVCLLWRRWWDARTGTATESGFTWTVWYVHHSLISPFFGKPFLMLNIESVFGYTGDEGGSKGQVVVSGVRRGQQPAEEEEEDVGRRGLLPSHVVFHI
jgi:hypothetical protein